MKKRYRDVAARIMADLKAGVLKTGDAMPSETVLCERFDASRSTIRNAMAELEKLGLIERKQGAATRILSTEPTQTYVHSMSAAGDLMQFAGPSWRKVHKTAAIVADENLAQKLQDRPGRHWIRISQTRHIDTLSAPVGWTDVYLSQEYADIVEEIPTYPGLVYSLLEARHDVVIHEIQQSIGAGPVPRELADILQVEIGDHALELRRNYLDKDGVGLIITLSILPAQHYSYDITLQRRA